VDALILFFRCAIFQIAEVVISGKLFAAILERIQRLRRSAAALVPPGR
jgi:hypothetical protein